MRRFYTTVVIGYKNTLGSREKCSYSRYVLITGVLITDCYCNLFTCAETFKILEFEEVYTLKQGYLPSI